MALSLAFFSEHGLLRWEGRHKMERSNITQQSFLYGHPTGETDAIGAKRYRMYLVTNRPRLSKGV